VEIENLVEHWKPIVQDPTFPAVREWKEKSKKGAVGFFPVYTPVELIHACGFLPVALMGAGNQMEITHADARFGSFICSIAKSTMELGLRQHLDPFSAIIFHSICDTARNLAYLFKRNFDSDLFVEYIHFPQNPSSPGSVDYLAAELARVKANLEDLAGKKISDDQIHTSIQLYNHNRSWIRELYNARRNAPHLLSTSELYVLLRAGNFLPPEEHSLLLIEALDALGNRQTRMRDSIRVVLEGSFCEQPPLELLQAIENAGCYVVDDDLIIGRRWFVDNIRNTGDPLRALAEAYVNKSVYSSVRHDWQRPRTAALLEKVRRNQADAVLFCIAKFCEPAYFDYVLFKDQLEKENIPHLLVEFEEKMWTFEKARTEVETFVESILFD
jgi:benzoyl-CoA reductase subunit C